MKKIEFYYFCLYNFFYKDNRPQKTYYFSQLEVEDRPVFLLALGTLAWTAVIRYLLVNLIFARTIFSFNGWVESGILLSAYAVYFFYFNNHFRYREIYVQYRLTDQALQDRISRNILIFLIFPLLPLFLWLVFNLQRR
jgi:hypothetical protein